MRLQGLCAALALLAGTAATCTTSHAADVGVSVQISQPGIYGRVDIGRLPVPQLVLPSPVIIAPPRAPRVVIGVAPPPPPPPQPVYMWVPPGHQKNWRKHCHRYNACGVPVYFVQDRWYNDNVRPRGQGKGHDKDRGRDRDDHDRGRDNDDHDHDRGRGDGRGKGHDRRD